ncbi:hypothetical protein CEAn_00320 [Coxiella endosymbiont of Amblyomma nuttalli]|nr:hypothetical protein CEAn_00320 [Coxiella endosymbiont of Amblyomma nuttalli]
MLVFLKAYSCKLVEFKIRLIEYQHIRLTSLAKIHVIAFLVHYDDLTFTLDPI